MRDEQARVGNRFDFVEPVSQVSRDAPGACLLAVGNDCERPVELHSRACCECCFHAVLRSDCSAHFVSPLKVQKVREVE